MTTIESSTPTSQAIEALKAEVERDPDLVNKVTLASVLEQAGRSSEAEILYKEIIEQDQEGIYSSVARKALEKIGNYSSLSNVNTIQKEAGLAYQQPTHKFKSGSSQSRQGWKSLKLHTKLNILLIASIGLPFILMSQVLLNSVRTQTLQNARDSLEMLWYGFKNNYISQLNIKSQILANNLSNLIQTSRINLSQFSQISPKPQLLENSFNLNETIDSQLRPFQIITDDRGRNIFQRPQTLLQYPAFRTNYPASIPKRVDLTTIPIVKYALKAKRPLFGVELLTKKQLQMLGLENQIVLPLNSHPNQHLSKLARFSSDRREALLVSMAVHPIKINKQIVGTAITSIPYSYTYFRNASSYIKTYKNISVVTVLAKDVQAIESDASIFAGVAEKTKILEIINTVLTRGQELSGTLKISGEKHLFFCAPIYNHQQLINSSSKPIGTILISQTLTEVENRLMNQQLYAYTIGGIIFLIATIIIIKLTSSFVRPLKYLISFSQAVGSGKQGLRIKDTYIQRQDEIGVLSRNLNAIAANTEATLKALHQQEFLQLQEKERLECEMIDLLLHTQTAMSGNLTARARVNQGITGSIADAFNTVIFSLQEVVLRVKIATEQVCRSAADSQISVSELDQAAVTQTEILEKCLSSVKAIEISVQSVAEASHKVAQTAHQVLTSATEGVQSMEQTANSIKTLCTNVTQTSAEAKLLAESSQEIYKIVSIISNISEKTDVLALNATLEATKAGEHGQGFRLVADEVRRLARQVTQATQEIEQLVSTMQQGTSDVLRTMEASSMQVGVSTEMVARTKLILLEVVSNSEAVDRLLQSITQETTLQVESSRKVYKTMPAVVASAQTASTESAKVSLALQNLLKDIQELQASVSQFQVE